MSALVTAGMIVGGLILAFAGVSIFDIAVSVIGFSIGGVVAYSYVQTLPEQPTADPSLVTVAGAVLVGGLVGFGLVWLIIELAVLVPGFVAGAGATATVLDPGPMAQIEGVGWLPVLVGGVIGAAIAWALFRILIAVVTAFVGAAMVALGGSFDRIVDAVQSVDPSAIPVGEFSLLFWAVFVLGTLAQLTQLAAGVADTEAERG